MCFKYRARVGSILFNRFAGVMACFSLTEERGPRGTMVLRALYVVNGAPVDK